MNEPCDAGRARQHILDLIETTNCSQAAIARAAGVNRKTIAHIHNRGRLISTDTEAKILAITPQDMLQPAPPLDEVLLRRLIRGDNVDLPYGGKAVYHCALHERGWNREHIAFATKSSYEHVRYSLLAADADRVKLDAVRWSDAYRSAVRRERAWQDYAKGLERVVARVMEIAEACRIPAIRDAIRNAVMSRKEQQP